ncbi:MAG: hypothetical protein RLZZ04_4945 [Cyanobacteriota bacterium]
MSQMFFRLTHHDWVECFTKLSRAELGVLFYLRTLNPFGDRHLKINCQAIGEVLDIHRTSVSRALKKLEKENLIELEITSAQVKLKSNDSDTKQDSENNANSFIDSDSASSVHPRTGCASTHGECASTHGECASTHGSVHPRTICAPEPLPDKVFEVSQTIKTYIDFKDSLSESEREKFFNFTKEKTNNLERPINDLEAWLASKNAAKQNRWEIYYRSFQEEQINEGRKTTRHSENGGKLSPSKMQQAIAELPENVNSDGRPLGNLPTQNTTEEYRHSAAEINKLLDNPPERFDLLAQTHRERIAEVKRQQAEIRRANREAAESRAKQQNSDPEPRKLETLRQIEEFNQRQSSQNSDLDAEDGSNE